MTTNAWRNRIVKTGTADPFTLLENPANWRVHPDVQKKALLDVLTNVGWVDEVMVNIRTGIIVDGHLRVWLAREQGEKEIPVEYVDLTDEEQDLILSVFDQIAGLAQTDEDTLTELKSALAQAQSFVEDVLTDIQQARESIDVAIKERKERGQGNTMLRIDKIIAPIPREAYLRWRESMYQDVGFKPKDIMDETLKRMGLK